ncbi:MAG: hypothetical protein J0H65_16990, partial [Rhizobiales bacterium]|nr:hypothetical protein [Hyphomicrobiales bacterium]
MACVRGQNVVPALSAQGDCWTAGNANPLDELDSSLLDDGAPQAAAECEPAPAAKRVFIKTFGCQMNVYDSERMSEALAAQGYVETGEPAEADLAILNTCHIREKAAEKVYSDLGRLRDIKRERAKGGKETLITVAGCVAQAEGEEI